MSRNGMRLKDASSTTGGRRDRWLAADGEKFFAGRVAEHLTQHKSSRDWNTHTCKSRVSRLFQSILPGGTKGSRLGKIRRAGRERQCPLQRFMDFSRRPRRWRRSWQSWLTHRRPARSLGGSPPNLSARKPVFASPDTQAADTLPRFSETPIGRDDIQALQLGSPRAIQSFASAVANTSRVRHRPGCLPPKDLR